MQNPFKKWGTSPEADWQVMFGIFGILTGVAILGSVVLFYVVELNSLAPADVATEILNQNALHHAALYYDQKSADFNRIKTTSETIPDPSK